MLATCRHSLVLKALDMERGEMYAYPYILPVNMSIHEYFGKINYEAMHSKPLYM